MKRLTYILSILVAGALSSSCHGDLNVSQPSEYTSLNVWQESTMMSEVYGAYTTFRSATASNMAFWSEYRSGLYDQGLIDDTSIMHLKDNIIMKSNTGTNWADLYKTINLANLAIKHAGQIQFSNENTKNTVLANSLYLRAWCYFIIARVWGDAPLLTEGFESDDPESMFPSRTPVAQLYAQIEKDLEDAAKYVTGATVSHYTTNKEAIAMLTADYDLWMAGRESKTEYFKKAETALQTVLGSSTYKLQSDFSKVFGVANENNAEIISSLDYNTLEFTGGAPSLYLCVLQYVTDPKKIENPLQVGSHNQYVTPTKEYEAFLKSVPAGVTSDKRLPVTFKECDDTDIYWRWFAKFTGTWANETRTFDSDMILYRVGEAYLMMAEALNGQNKPSAAVGYINQLVKRAYGMDSAYSTSLTQAQVTDVIIDEYLKEFACENKSFFTIVRNGKAFTRIPSLVGRQSEQNILYIPVADACMNTNSNITQTPGLDK